MQLAHTALADRIHPLEDLLCRRNRFIIEILDQFVGRLPGRLAGFAYDHMQTDTETDLTPFGVGERLHLGDLLGDFFRRLAPGQIFVDRASRNLLPDARRTAEVKGRMRVLIRGEENLAIFDVEVLAFVIDGFAPQQRLVDVQELLRHLIPFLMRNMDAIALVFDRIAASDDIDQKPTVRKPVERCRHPRR